VAYDRWVTAVVVVDAEAVEGTTSVLHRLRSACFRGLQCGTWPEGVALERHLMLTDDDGVIALNA